MNTKLLNLKIYIEKSKYRIKIMKTIDNETKTPTQIAKESGIRIGHVSDVLRKLKKENLVECINEEVRKGRLYQLTDIGLEVRNVLR